MNQVPDSPLSVPSLSFSISTLPSDLSNQSSLDLKRKSEDEEPTKPPADDQEAMMQRYFPLIPDLEVEDEAIFTWQIDDWRSLQKREHSPGFMCGGQEWKILLFPYGNNVEFASIYLEKEASDAVLCGHFMLAMWNPAEPTVHMTQAAHHRFNAEGRDWGFTKFADLRKLIHRWEDSDRPMIENGKVNITAYVRVYKDPTGVLWHDFVDYDSKKETGMVGLKNQGATCYLNSLLQSLYFTIAFREAVYQIPTEQQEDRKESAYALQRLFYQLQTNSQAVSTQELTVAFGWDSRQIFEQQDVQELSRVLMDRLETRMKGTAADNALANLFVGKTKTYISCVNVDYESSKVEDFWDIQLNVSGNKNLDDSFKDYIQVETMEGENKYFAEGHGLQDAKKGVIFESFPNVLHLQLKRFEYDINSDAMMKVNDRYEFPEVWDASPYLSETADKSEPYVYHLYGVLVHSGDLNAGHYYAFIKPTKDGRFYKFDDDRVTRATNKEAMDENFGGDFTPTANGINGQRNPYTRQWSTKRSNSAYMLVYLRASRLDQIMAVGREVLPPPHLEVRMKEERAALERRRKEREEAHLYMNVQVADLSHFQAHQGFDICKWDIDDRNDPSCARTFRVMKKATLRTFMETIAEELGAQGQLDFVRPWVLVNRNNGTCRPDKPLRNGEETLEEIASKHLMRRDSELKLWMELAQKDANGNPVFGDQEIKIGTQDASNRSQKEKPLFIFIKYFDPQTQSLRGLDTLFVASHTGLVQDIVPRLAPKLGLQASGSPGNALWMFEEIKPTMVEALKLKSTWVNNEIQDGDIICVQKPVTEEENRQLSKLEKFTRATDFYDYLVNRLSVTFMPKLDEITDENTFTLDLSRRMTYPQFAAKVGERLGVDPTHLRFCTVNANTRRPRPPFKIQPNTTLGSVLQAQYAHSGNPTHLPDALYYEVLEFSLSEMETRKNVKITWLSEGISKEETFECFVPKNGDISDVLQIMQRKANVSDEVMSTVRVYEVHSNKVYKLLSPQYSVASINEFVTLYAEPIPEEERDIPEGDFLATAFHFDREPNMGHDIPFYFLVKKDEPFSETKKRLSKRTGLKGRNFEKIKFAMVPSSSRYIKPAYLNDDDILSEKFKTNDDCLGLDHPNRTKSAWNRAESIFIR